MTLEQGLFVIFPEHTWVGGHGASEVSPVSASLEVFTWVLGQSGGLLTGQ